MLPPATFPANRPRRLRASPWIRSMVSENLLTPADFIWPCFVIEGTDASEDVPSMDSTVPPQSRWQAAVADTGSPNSAAKFVRLF